MQECCFHKIFFFILSAFILWVLPSGLIVVSNPGAGQPLERVVLLFLLTFVRWNVAGAALVYQLNPHWDISKKLMAGFIHSIVYNGGILVGVSTMIFVISLLAVSGFFIIYPLLILVTSVFNT